MPSCPQVPGPARPVPGSARRGHGLPGPAVRGTCAPRARLGSPAAAERQEGEGVRGGEAWASFVRALNPLFLQDNGG